MPPSPLIKLRKICLALPEAHEVEAWGEPTFRVSNKLFAMYAAQGNHHGSGRAGVWCNSTQTNQDLLIRSDPQKFFSPPYVGPKGWVGIFLHKKPDWDLVADILRDAWKLTAPKKLHALLGETPR
ncbi:MAG TPA: MmcQ/YjbR family DNA-binding protein [Gemmatimonadaceae bacterium]|nr:MmcQ/YjbR family DNA-binding protein [Gemmatimonadaceae bacterium]